MMEEYYDEDILLIAVAKLVVRTKTIDAGTVREEFSIGGKRANMLLERLVELNVVVEEENYTYTSSTDSVFLLGKFFVNAQKEIDEFISKLENGSPKDFDVNNYGLDFEFDYSFERSCDTPFRGSILSYYLIKKIYWQQKPQLNVMIHMLEKGSEVNPILNISGDGSYLIEYLLDLMKNAQNIAGRKSTYEVVQQYIFAIKGAGKYDETIEEYEERLMLNAKK